MSIQAEDISNFLNEVIDNQSLQRMFCNVWIDKNSFYNIFTTVSSGKKNVSKRSFIIKSNIIAESKLYSLHHKKVWNTTSKVCSVK